VITGGTERGVNLYHSFQQFSIPTGGEAWFNNAARIQNILTRVTGTSSSIIDGLIRANGIANLYLLNPNGIVFSPNARLNIGGSFVATTANSFKFPGGEYGVTNLNQEPPLLTVSITPGVQYGAIAAGSTITNRGNLTAGQDLTLVADRLDLQGQLVAGRDLTLQAQNTVQIRGTVTTPLPVQSGRDLTIQGNQGVDILAFDDPQATIQSGRNLSLVSDGVISGGAHFFSGGTFQIRTLSGQLANFTSLYAPIISSAGNVDINANYTGASLLIESQGSVRIQGAVTINSRDLFSSFIGDDRVLLNQPGLIIRSGQTSLRYGGNNQNNPPFSPGTVPDGITLEGPVQAFPLPISGPFVVRLNGGVVKLTADNGGITFHSIDVSSRTGGNGGNIELTATGDIHNTGSFTDAQLGNAATLGSFSYNTDIGSNPGSGGNISLTSKQGNITLDQPIVSSTSKNGGTGFGSGNGGEVKLTADNGSITFQRIDVSSQLGGNGGNGGSIELMAKGDILGQGGLNSSSFAVIGDIGNGGNISLTSQSGRIFLQNSPVNSFSSTGNGNPKNGGAISFTATNISLKESRVSSSSQSGGNDTQTAGAISFTATNGNIDLKNSPLDAYSGAPTGFQYGSFKAGDGGAISLTAINGDVSLVGTGLNSSSTMLLGNTGQAGAISVNATQNVSLTDSPLDAFSKTYQGITTNGGAISLTANNGDIFLTRSPLSSYSFAYEGAAGTGGAIYLNASRGKIASEATTLNSYVVTGNQQNSGNGGMVALGAGSSISGVNINTVSSGGLSGNVQINGSSDLLMQSTQILTAQQVVMEFPFPFSTQTITLTNRARAGDVAVLSKGNLTLTDSRIQSDTLGANPSGNITITSPGILSFNNSEIRSNTSGTGKAGDITIYAPTVSVRANSQIRAETAAGSSGNGGTIRIDAPTAVDLTRTPDGIPVVSVESNGAGRAGDIKIDTPQLTLSDAAKITATATATSTNQEGGGSVTLNASNINLAGGKVGVFAETKGQTPAGILTLTPYTGQSSLNVLFTPGSIMSASTSSSGRGGNFILSAPQSIDLVGQGELSVKTTNSGDAGNMFISTQTLNLRDGVQLLATTSNTGNGGQIAITVGQMNLSQGARLATTTSSSGQAGNITVTGSDRLSLSDPGTGLFAETAIGSAGNGGSIDLTTRNLTLNKGAQLRASTSGQGNAGNVAIRSANTVALATDSAISTATYLGATGQGGDITLQTGQLTLNSNAQITASTASPGRAGNVAITTNRFEASGRGRILTTTSSSGQAGNITIQFSDRFTLRGTGSGFNDLNDTGIYAGTTAGSTGNGGSIRIAAQPGTRPSITIRNGAKIAVNSEGEGNGGDIKITTPGRITLDNRAFVNATTDSGRGGNINIDPDIILMRRNSQISTSAGRNRGGGDGGNISITAGFLIAVPFENSDITANAYSGSGGNIRITANRIFGFYPAPAGILNTPFSDIAASSQLGINGTVILNNLNLDPSQGLGELNLAPIDGSQLIVPSCVTGKQQTLNENRFVITGRNGLPASPEDVFRDPEILTELGTSPTTDTVASSDAVSPPAPTTTGIIEAQSWIVAPNGKIRLVAGSTAPPGSPPQPSPMSCP
jgi:filamentous hemagglutinin family protein